MRREKRKCGPVGSLCWGVGRIDTGSHGQGRAARVFGPAGGAWIYDIVGTPTTDAILGWDRGPREQRRGAYVSTFVWWIGDSVGGYLCCWSGMCRAYVLFVGVTNSVVF